MRYPPLTLSGSTHAKRALIALSAATHFRVPGGETVTEADARWALDRLQRVPVRVESLGVESLGATIETTFYRSEQHHDGAPVLFLHGGDSTCLEWRHVMRQLTGHHDCIAVDWWTGGWTSRGEVTAAVVEGGAAPWDCIRAHLYAFWAQELEGRPVQLVGTSMGGAVAIDFARAHPEAVSRLVLVDSGGESYAAPPPVVGSLLAPVCPVVLRAVAWLTPRLGERAALGSLHRTASGWIEAYVAYLGSGGYEISVGPEAIRQLQQPTLVVWGEDDPVLPPSDARKFERDLPHCERVAMIAGGGHCPQLLQTEAVVEELVSFLSP